MSFNEDENQQQIKSEIVNNQTGESCGSILYAERKKQNLSIEHISSQINLSEIQIRALESDKYDMLASASYVKGYIRLYANLLGLNVDEVLIRFKEPEQIKHASLSEIGQGIHKTKPIGKHGLARSFLWILALSGLGVFIWFTVNKENSATTAVASLNKFGNQTDTNSVAQESNKSATEKSKVAANTDFLAPVYGKQHLLMTFNDSVWVEIIDGSERQIINKRYKTGEKMSAYVQPPMRIFISNVNAVNMQYNQSEYDLAVHKQGAFAKFVLKRP